MKKGIIKNALLLLCGISCYACQDSFSMEVPSTDDANIKKYDGYFQAIKKNMTFTPEEQINNNLNLVGLMTYQVPFLIANLIEEDISLCREGIIELIRGVAKLQTTPDHQTFPREYADKADLYQLTFFIKSNVYPEKQDFKFLSENVDSNYLLALAKIVLAIGRSIYFLKNNLNHQGNPVAFGACALRAYQLNMKNILWIKPENNFERQAIIRNAGRIVFDFFGFTESEFITDSSDEDMRQIEASEKTMFSREDTKYKEKTTEDPTIILLNHLLDHVHIWLKEWNRDDFKMYCLHKNRDRQKSANSAVVVPKKRLPITNWYTQTLATLCGEKENVITRTRDTHDAVYFLIPFYELHKHIRPEWTSATHTNSNYMLFGINCDGVLKTMFPSNFLKVEEKNFTDEHQ